MSDWDKYGFIYENNDEQHRELLNSTGEESIKHYGLITYGDPSLESFLSEISVVQHIYSMGDSLSKIAYNQYGDAKFWWILAWFNSRPTDLHCSVGDTILIPLPLDVAIAHAYSVEQL